MTGSNYRRTRIAFLLVLFASSWVFFFLGLGSYSLKEPDEGRYAEIPREMVEQGDYVVPHLNYIRYFEKPPLLYWMTAASYKLLGVSEWAFRLPNALMALLCVLATYLFAARAFGRRMALISSLILASSFGFFAMARIVTIDMLFAFLLFASLLCFCRFYRERRRFFLYSFYVTMALGVLAKGPVAIVLLGATIFLFLLSEKKLSFLKDTLSPGGLALLCVIALPWFVVMCVKEKEFFQFFVVDQNVLRFLTSKHKRSGPIYYFLPVLFGGLFPWSFFLPRAVLRLWRSSELRLFFIWALVVFVFFSLSGSKLPPYILPIYPALAVILGFLFDEGWRGRIEGSGELAVYGGFFLCLAAAGFACGTGAVSPYLTRLPDIAAVIGDIRGFSMGLAVISLASLVLLSMKKGRTYLSLFCALTAFSMAVVVLLMADANVIDGVNTTKALAQRIKAGARPDAAVINYRSFDETLPFYLARRTYIAEFTGELEMGAKYPEAKAYFLSRDDAAKMISERPVFVVMKAKRLPSLESLGLNQAGIIGRQDDRVLIANRAAMGEESKGRLTGLSPKVREPEPGRREERSNRRYRS